MPSLSLSLSLSLYQSSPSFLFLTTIANAAIGLTVVTEVGGNAALASAVAASGGGILPGDCLTGIEVNGEFVALECLNYDNTVAGLQSAMALLPDGEGEVKIFSKRVRKRPKVQLTLQFPGGDQQELELFSGENLRTAMLVRGVQLNDPLAERFDNGGTGSCGADGE